MGRYRLNETFENALVAWIEGVLPLHTVIWDKQDTNQTTPRAPVPDLPFTMLNIISGPTSTGGVDKIYKTIDTFTLRHRQKFTLSINVHAEDGYLEDAFKIKKSLAKDTILNTLRESGLHYWTNTDPIDASQLFETGHEFRAIMDVVFAFSEDDEDTPGEIRKVRVQKTDEPTFDTDIEDPIP